MSQIRKLQYRESVVKIFRESISQGSHTRIFISIANINYFS